jgi:hypothetical protein
LHRAQVPKWSDSEDTVELTQATAAAQPSVQLFNGKKVLRLDGTDNGLASAALATPCKSLAKLVRITPGSAAAIRYGLVGGGHRHAPGSCVQR